MPTEYESFALNSILLCFSFPIQRLLQVLIPSGHSSGLNLKIIFSPLDVTTRIVLLIDDCKLGLNFGSFFSKYFFPSSPSMSSSKLLEILPNTIAILWLVLENHF